MTGGPILYAGVDGRLNQRALLKICVNTSITELTLLDISFENHQLEQILGLFSYDRRQWQELAFSSCLGAVERIIDAVIQDKCGRLRFYACDMTSAIAEALKRGLESPFTPLVELSWSEGGSIPIEAMHLLGDGLRATTFLETLNLSQAVVENDVLLVLADSLAVNSSLTTLNIFGCDLSDDLVALLMDSIPQSIQELYLGRNRCRALGIRTICNFLESNDCRICKLSLYEQQLVDGEEGMDLSTLASALERNISLECLNLSYNKLDDEDMQFLAIALTQNATLRELTVHNTGISDRGMEEFCSRLPDMKGLKMWTLGGMQQFDPELASHFILEGLRTNVTLESIISPAISLTPNAAEMQHYVALNQGGRRLLQESNVTRGLWPLVIERATRIMKYEENGLETSSTIIFTLLRGPVLLER
jgi:hypothetical protein